MDKADKSDVLQSTRRPFKSKGLAFSHKVNRLGQRNRAIDAVNVYDVNYEFYVSDSVLYIIHFTHFVAINLNLLKAL